MILWNTSDFLQWHPSRLCWIQFVLLLRGFTEINKQWKSNTCKGYRIGKNMYWIIIDSCRFWYMIYNLYIIRMICSFAVHVLLELLMFCLFLSDLLDFCLFKMLPVRVAHDRLLRSLGYVAADVGARGGILKLPWLDGLTMDLVTWGNQEIHILRLQWGEIWWFH